MLPGLIKRDAFAPYVSSSIVGSCGSANRSYHLISPPITSCSFRKSATEPYLVSSMLPSTSCRASFPIKSQTSPGFAPALRAHFNFALNWSAFSVGALVKSSKRSRTITSSGLNRSSPACTPDAMSRQNCADSTTHSGPRAALNSLQNRLMHLQLLYEREGLSLFGAADTKRPRAVLLPARVHRHKVVPAVKLQKRLTNRGEYRRSPTGESRSPTCLPAFRPRT